MCAAPARSPVAHRDPRVDDVAPTRVGFHWPRRRVTAKAPAAAGDGPRRHHVHPQPSIVTQHEQPLQSLPKGPPPPDAAAQHRPRPTATPYSLSCSAPLRNAPMAPR